MIVPIKQSALKKKEPYYILRYNYMIGDANGYTIKEVEISKDNPFLEWYFTLLSRVKPIKGHYGVILSKERLKRTYEEGQLTLEEYDFLLTLMFEDSIPTEGFNKFLDVEKYISEFCEGVIEDVGYGTWVSLKDLELYYVDEHGNKFNTRIVNL